MSDDVAKVLAGLAAEFPREAISWRAQNVTKEGDKALALAYIDARDVMDRLDQVVGPMNWSTSYDVHPNVTICSIAIRINGEWVTKADGAGDTDVEAEKGRISDSLKRAAVHWGVARYLYAIPSPWVPCDSYMRGEKMVWKRWTANPWDYVKLTAKPPQSAAGGPEIQLPNSAAKEHWKLIYDGLNGCTTTAQLNGLWERHKPVIGLLGDELQGELQDHYRAMRAGFEGKTDAKASLERQFPGDVELTHAQKIARTP